MRRTLRGGGVSPTSPRTRGLLAGAGQAPVLLALAAAVAKAVGGLPALALARPWDG
jgi:hypothetical protein